MYGATASKLITSLVLVVAAAGGPASGEKTSEAARIQKPVVPASTSLLVATMADGQLEMEWVPREICEQVSSSVAAGDAVAGVRPDGVRVYIAKANCSTPRVDPEAPGVKLTAVEGGN
ncbi:hypothetical protein [Hyphomicrobium sp.]|uniref:hypothetical protein n=1 Tax=Hyphomicrobium sp. TaxID=82 RepID=UPI000FA520F7|nr:hypothetical protein [Hyphomicrobium sp.]RUP00520.1 MAG: hypothetical protein EKK30_00185 [Hyphomicrobium sp.]